MTARLSRPGRLTAPEFCEGAGCKVEGRPETSECCANRPVGRLQVRWVAGGALRGRWRKDFVGIT